MDTMKGKKFISAEYGEFGSVCWRVSEGWGEGMNKRHNKSSELRLADCYKVIALDFDYSGYDQYKERLDKIDCLIEELQKFKEALEVSWGKE